jgi:hypothetical protein
MTPFQEGEDDKDIPAICSSNAFVTPDLTQDDASITQKEVHIGPITRSRAKKLQQEVNSLLNKINFFMYENVILPKSSTLVVLRYIHEDGNATKYGHQVNNKKQTDQGTPVRTKVSEGFRLDDRSNNLENQGSPNLNEDPGDSLRTTTSDQFWTCIKNRP